MIENEKIIGTLTKNREEEVRVTTLLISGRPYISIGVFMKADGLFRRGVTLSPHTISDLLPVLGVALKETQADERP